MVWMPGLERELRFSQRRVYVAGAGALVAIGASYAVRAQLQPGYLTAVWNNELFGRYSAIEEHSGNVFVYLVAMRWWNIVLIFALPTLLRQMAGEFPNRFCHVLIAQIP